MSILQKFLPNDSSSQANFYAWGYGLSSVFAAAGFQQTNDTGQIVWIATALALTACTVSGSSTNTYTFSAGGTGPALRVGMAFTIAGFGNGSNNGTFTITAFTGSVAAGGTITVAYAAGMTSQSATATAVTTVTSYPTSTNTFAGYELWAFTDTLASTFPILMKIQYGRGNNAAYLQITTGSYSNGAGTLSGNVLGPYPQTYTGQAGGGATLYECDFTFDGPYSSGTVSGSRFGMMLFRDYNGNSGPQFFAIERNLTSAGAYGSTYYTVWMLGMTSNATSQAAANLQGWSAADSGNINWGTLSTVPAASSYIYEIWKCTDALASTYPYYVKIEYGTSASNSCPMLRITIGQGAAGSGGTLTGQTIGPFYLQAGNTPAETAGATFECDFSSDGNGSAAGQRLGILMWRTAANANRPSFFCVERALNSSGVYQATYVTAVSCGYNSALTIAQQSLYVVGQGNGAQSNALTTLATINTNAASLVAVSQTPFLPVFPLVGDVDPFMTAVGTTKSSDSTEGATNTATLYGTSHTFLTSQKTNFASCGNGTNNAIAMRYD